MLELSRSLVLTNKEFNNYMQLRKPLVDKVHELLPKTYDKHKGHNEFYKPLCKIISDLNNSCKMHPLGLPKKLQKIEKKLKTLEDNIIWKRLSC